MYKLIWTMAWKNSFARPARTLLLVMMISVSMSMMLAIEGLYDGMSLNMISKNKRSSCGDISLFAKNYLIDTEIKDLIKNADTISEQIRKMEGVKAVTVRLKAHGLLATARKSSFGSIIGIDLQEEEKFGKFSAFLKEGRLDLEKNGVLIGLELAKRLKVDVGSKVIFSTQDLSGEINSMALKVRGILQTTNIELDTNAVFVDLKKLHTFLGVDPKDATQIALMEDDKDIYAKLKRKYPNLDVKSFLELEPMMKQMQDMMGIFNSISFVIVMSVVFVGIFGVMYVSILDRVREFGIMLSIGMRYKYIRTQIYLEAVFIGLLGYVSGAFLGLLVLLYLKYYGLDLSAFSDALEMWGYESIIYGTIKFSYFSTTFVAILSASILSVLIPLRKIKKLNPIDVIRSEK